MSKVAGNNVGGLASDAGSATRSLSREVRRHRGIDQGLAELEQESVLARKKPAGHDLLEVLRSAPAMAAASG
jgi:hypothetical protein